MVTGPEEQFIHLVTCISRLHSALETLRLVKAASPDNPLIAPAFRFALVEYVSPYTKSNGQFKKYTLALKYVPPEHLDLHHRLVTARHQVHAHDDLRISHPTFRATGTRANPSAEVTGTYVDELKELPSIDQLISLINDSIHNMYVDRDAQLKALSR